MFCLIRADRALRMGHVELIQRSAVKILASVRWALTPWAALCTLSDTKWALSLWSPYCVNGTFCTTDQNVLERGSKYQNQAVEWHVTSVKINGVSLWDVIKQVGGQETNELIFVKYAERVTSKGILPGKWWIRMEINWWSIWWPDVEMCMQWSKGVLQSITLCQASSSLKRTAAFLIKCSRAVLLKLQGK